MQNVLHVCKPFRILGPCSARKRNLRKRTQSPRPARCPPPFRSDLLYVLPDVGRGVRALGFGAQAAPCGRPGLVELWDDPRRFALLSVLVVGVGAIKSKSWRGMSLCWLYWWWENFLRKCVAAVGGGQQGSRNASRSMYFDFRGRLGNKFRFDG